VLIAILSKLGASEQVLDYLFIADPNGGGLNAIASGEVWRLITPIFIHFGLMHIVFNMMWMWDLGKLVELRRGTLFLAIFVIVDGVASNLMQYGMTQSPFFGGMSGVVYGLLGFVWMQGKYNPHFGYLLHKPTVVMMLAWYVLCWTGLLGPVANWAHTGGLLIGIGWGFVSRGKFAGAKSL
ncbi:MAG TPA: rhomboid family intramembrane serine protease, partial [Burkholderiaceae bacterium]|nr:rhomboid family intramembrane serine protease [Burkholderiaceae bacterium]